MKRYLALSENLTYNCLEKKRFLNKNKEKKTVKYTKMEDGLKLR